MSWWVESGVFD